MQIYVFGNPDHHQDSITLTILEQLQPMFPDVNFQVVKPNQDLPFVDQDNVLIMDAVEGITKVTLIQDQDIEKLIMPPRGTAHDFGLGFQLKYLKKLGKLGTVTIIGLPLTGKIDIEIVEKFIRQYKL